MWSPSGSWCWVWRKNSSRRDRLTSSTHWCHWTYPVSGKLAFIWGVSQNIALFIIFRRFSLTHHLFWGSPFIKKTYLSYPGSNGFWIAELWKFIRQCLDISREICYKALWSSQPWWCWTIQAIDPKLVNLDNKNFKHWLKIVVRRFTIGCTKHIQTSTKHASFS